MAKKDYHKKIVEAILAKDFEKAEQLVRESVKGKLFKAFVKEDEQLTPGNKVKSTDLPGSPAETDGDTVGAGEGIPSDFQDKVAPETDGRGADGGSAGGDDPGSSGLDDGGISKDDADYGPAVVTEEEDEDDGEDSDEDKEEMKEFRAWKEAKRLAEQEDEDDDDDSDDDDPVNEEDEGGDDDKDKDDEDGDED